jgi:precorrin-6A/cobalt-precorrin-6A reductase
VSNIQPLRDRASARTRTISSATSASRPEMRISSGVPRYHDDEARDRRQPRRAAPAGRDEHVARDAVEHQLVPGGERRHRADPRDDLVLDTEALEDVDHPVIQRRVAPHEERPDAPLGAQQLSDQRGPLVPPRRDVPPARRIIGGDYAKRTLYVSIHDLTPQSDEIVLLGRLLQHEEDVDGVERLDGLDRDVCGIAGADADQEDLVHMRVLILGGTTEARELAEALHARGDEVTTSLAGRTRPADLSGTVRIGSSDLSGFDAVVDATHPFATRISDKAAGALRLERPGWDPQPGDIWVEDVRAAAAHCPGRRVLLTTGHTGLDAFEDVDASILVRAITPPATRHAVLLDRGPFTLESERKLLRDHAIDLLVTKDSGGPAPKLQAARERNIPIVIVRRPRPRPPDAVATVEAALSRLRRRPGASAADAGNRTARSAPPA